MVCIRKENVLRPLTDMPSDMRSRIRHLIPVRDAVRDCLRSQMDGSTEERVLETPSSPPSLPLHSGSQVSSLGRFDWHDQSAVAILRCSPNRIAAFVMMSF